MKIMNDNLIQIAVTFWNRFSSRLDCLKRVFHSLEENMNFGKYRHQWIISSESDRCENREDVETFFKQNNIIYAWKEGKASLASNLNNVLKMCSAPLIIYLQDDWELIHKIDIEKDADFLLSSPYDLIRLRYHDAEINKMKLINKDLQLYEIEHAAINLYSDQPHLKKLSFHNNFGYFPESTWRGYDSGDCEIKFNGMIQMSSARLLYKNIGYNIFAHISEQTTLKEKWEGWHKCYPK